MWVYVTMLVDDYGTILCNNRSPAKSDCSRNGSSHRIQSIVAARAMPYCCKGNHSWNVAPDHDLWRSVRIITEFSESFLVHSIVSSRDICPWIHVVARLRVVDDGVLRLPNLRTVFSISWFWFMTSMIIFVISLCWMLWRTGSPIKRGCLERTAWVRWKRQGFSDAIHQIHLSVTTHWETCSNESCSSQCWFFAHAKSSHACLLSLPSSVPIGDTVSAPVMVGSVSSPCKPFWSQRVRGIHFSPDQPAFPVVYFY
jgi:hypothetical protein